jgi:hypothetical protein
VFWLSDPVLVPMVVFAVRDPPHRYSRSDRRRASADAPPTPTQGIGSIAPPLLRVRTRYARFIHLLENKHLNVSLLLGPLASLAAGILILAVPRQLNYIVAVYLIVNGLIGIFGTGSLHF